MPVPEPTDDVRRLLSIQSLWLDLRFAGKHIAHGTGFVVLSPSAAPVLVTARHNFTGRHHFTGECLNKNAAIPNEVAIAHNKRGHYGQWVERIEPLCDANETRLWYEHPTRGSFADIAALKLSRLDEEVELHPLPLTEGGQFMRILVGPAEIVSVIGFPFGRGSSGCFGIWASGFIATEPQHDYDGLPVILIDCRSRPGQSGAPVVAYRSEAIKLEGGGFALGTGGACRLLGLYSGRINAESYLGMVWKADVLRELVQVISI